MSHRLRHQRAQIHDPRPKRQRAGQEESRKAEISHHQGLWQGGGQGLEIQGREAGQEGEECVDVEGDR